MAIMQQHENARVHRCRSAPTGGSTASTDSESASSSHSSSLWQTKEGYGEERKISYSANVLSCLAHKASSLVGRRRRGRQSSAIAPFKAQREHSLERDEDAGSVCSETEDEDRLRCSSNISTASFASTGSAHSTASSASSSSPVPVEAERFMAVFIGVSEQELIKASVIISQLSSSSEAGVLVVLPRCHNRECNQVGRRLASMSNNITVVTSQSASVDTMSWPYYIGLHGIKEAETGANVTRNVCCDMVFTSSIGSGAEERKSITNENFLYTMSPSITCIVPREYMLTTSLLLEMLKRKLAREVLVNRQHDYIQEQRRQQLQQRRR